MAFEEKTGITKTNQAEDFKDNPAFAYLGKDLHSDMAFYLELEERTIPGHSSIVAAASPVLERFVCGTGHIRNASRVLTIRDCTSDDFVYFLSYIYSGKVQIESHETAATLLPMAYYYELCGLEEICYEYLNAHLTLQTVCDTFNLCYLFDNDQIIDRCLIVMRKNTQKLLLDGSLMRMNDQPLRLFLSHDSLNIHSDVEIFGPMVSWANSQCLEYNLVDNDNNRRLVLNKRFSMIRFVSMTWTEFTKCIWLAGPDFFTPEEIRMMMCVTNGDTFYGSPMDPPSLGSKELIPNITLKEFKLEYVKYASKAPQLTNVSSPELATYYPQTLEIRTFHSKEAGIRIRGFKIKQTDCEVFRLDSRGETPIECVHHLDRIMFDTPIPIDENASLRIFMKLQRGEQMWKVYDRFNAENDIYVSRDTMTTVQKVLYTCRNRRPSPRRGENKQFLW